VLKRFRHVAFRGVSANEAKVKKMPVHKPVNFILLVHVHFCKKVLKYLVAAMQQASLPDLAAWLSSACFSCFFNIFLEIPKAGSNLTALLLDISFYFQTIVVQYHARSFLNLPLASSTRPFI